MSSIACVLVNWNNFDDTSDCLTALALQTHPLTVLVVDNASTNDSVAHLRALHPWATYIQNSENAGFPRACNLGARHPAAAAADFLWLLNNDTIPPPDTAAKLLATALASPQPAVVGAVLHYAHDPTRIQAWGGGRISRWSAYNSHFLAPTPLGPDAYITFASAFIRRPVFDQLHGLYEGVFMYFEDADFCLRARAAGFHLAVAPTTAILHKEGASGAVRSPLIYRIVTTSSLTFLSRQAPIPRLAYALFLIPRLLRRLLTGNIPILRAVLHGLSDFRHHRTTPFA